MSFVVRVILFFFILISCFSCKQEKPLFVKHDAQSTNIHFSNNLHNTPELNILRYLYYYNGAGIATGDFNNDGLIDLYFTGNQTEDKLYINQGSFKFIDITQQSGINNSENWTTGVTTVDINNDGFLDIYICKIGNYKNIKGKNLLYVNQGFINGTPIFKEEASKYSLDFKGFSTQATFFDYDLDGDLDMFLLNHSVHPNRNYGKGKKRMEIDALSGDKLFENVNGSFIDVSSKAGVFQGKIGYGLGVSVSDVNNDGYPDIYVGNDFFENDYLYLNQKDKSYKEVITSKITSLGHTTHFSMGNSINDINNDGEMDIISLDMLPEDLKTYKASGLEYPYQTYEYYLKNGYAPQYMQNTLHLNIGNGNFSEVGFQSGIAATEWSWNPLVADFDNDGFKDIYITNGILGATNDMDFISFISNEKIQKQINNGMSEKDLSLIKDIPQKKIKNYFFKNNGDNTFINMTDKWSSEPPSFSNGAVYADLDNDGDLDIVVNNVNENALVLENLTNNLPEKKHNYLKVKFKGSDKNTFGIGTKVYVFSSGHKMVYENFTTRGYLSSVSPKINIGLGDKSIIDSLHIIWTNGRYQTLKKVTVNQEITVNYRESSGNYYKRVKPEQPPVLNNTDALFAFKHKDSHSLEFNRDPLIPYASTNLGPNISIADINNDKREDIFIGGGKRQSSQLFVQQENGTFSKEQNDTFQEDAINEDVDQLFFDANNDGYKDLIVVSGGNEFKKGKPLRPRFYFNTNGLFTKDTIQFQNLELNASTVKAVDIDNDGDLDLCITSNLIPWQFGKIPQQYIFENDGLGNFTDITSSFAKEFKSIGNIQDIIWIDLNADNFIDAIAVGHWMPISIFINNGKELVLQQNNNLKNTNGWWNTIKAADFDKDGDIDFVVGNWGLNTRLKASLNEPIILYSNDFDDNGSVDPVITYFYKGIETPFASKDELVKQMPFLNKKYLSYTTFAKAKFEDILPYKKINEASKKQTFELATSYFENLGNHTFKKHRLPFMAQVSSVNDIAIDDFNKDGFSDLLLVGNNYEISTQLGKLDASHGVLLLNDKKGFFTVKTNQSFDISGPARDIEKIKINGIEYLIVSINNNTPVFLRNNDN